MFAADHHAVHTEIIVIAAPEIIWKTLIPDEKDWSSPSCGLTGGSHDGDGDVVLRQTKDGDMTEFPLEFVNHEDGVQFGWSEEFSNAEGIFDIHICRVEATSECRIPFIRTDASEGAGAENRKRRRLVSSKRFFQAT